MVQISSIKSYRHRPREKTITNVTLHSNAGGTNNFVQRYLSPSVKGGEAVSLSYTPGDVQSADGVLVEIPSMDVSDHALTKKCVEKENNAIITEHIDIKEQLLPPDMVEAPLSPSSGNKLIRA